MAKAELIKARELIANGWVKTDLKRDVEGKPCYCLDGALAEAHGIDAFNMGDTDVYELLIDNNALHDDVKRVVDVLPENDKAILHEYIEDIKASDGFADGDDKNGEGSLEHTKAYQIKDLVVGSLWRFNDRPITTQQDVLDVLDKAIAKAE